MLRQKRRLVIILIMALGPLIILGLAAAKGWVHPETTWAWILLFLGGYASWMIFVRACVEVFSKLSEWRDSKSLESRREIGTSDFPFERTTPRELASKLPDLSWPEIPYGSRQSAFEQERMLGEMLQASQLLIVGRRGLGKTREAVELIRRIEAEKGEPVTVLVPQGPIDIPLKIPPDLPSRNLILFIDNLPARYAEPYRVEDFDNPRLIEDDFRQRFEQTLRRFLDYCRGYDFRVIATAIGEPELRDRLRLADPFWANFAIFHLPDLDADHRLEFLGALEVHFGIEITPEAKALLSERSDGTFSGLIVPLVKERSKGQITLADAREYRCLYPQDWEQTVYRQVIEPKIYRKNLLDALDIIRQAELVPFDFLVFDLAARLLADELFFWHRWRLKKALEDLSDWIDVSGRILSCPDAYLRGRAELSAAKQKLLTSAFKFTRSRRHFPLLRPSLYGLRNILLYKLDDPLAARDLNRAMLRADPANARIWSKLALVYLRLGEYEEAKVACNESIRLGDHANAWLTLANVCEVGHRYTDAVEACRRAIERDSYRALSWARLGVILSKKGDFELAIQAGKRAVELDPLNAFVRVALGISYDKAGQTQAAIDTCKEAISLDSDSAMAWQTLGVVYSRSKLLELATEACARATELNPNSATTWRLLARTLEGGERFSEAIRAMERAIAIEPQNARTWLALGVGLDRAGRREEALDALNEATMLDPNLIQAWQALARTANDMNQSGLALEALHQATILNPYDVGDWFHLGIAYREVKRYEDAIAALTRVTELAPGHVGAWRAVGALLNHLGSAERALKAALKVAELLPEDAGSYYILGIAYRKMNRYEEAVDALTKATELGPWQIAAWESLAAISVQTGQVERSLIASRKVSELRAARADDLGQSMGAAWKAYDSKDYYTAVDLCNRVIALDLRAVEAWRLLSSACSRSGRDEEAVAPARRVVDLCPVDATGWYTLGLRYSKVGQSTNAVEAYRQALKIKPNSRGASLELGKALIKLGRWEEGQEMLRKRVTEEPGERSGWIFYGQALVNMQHYDKAIAAFDSLAELAPDTVEWNLELGKLYQASHAYEKAQRAFERALIFDRTDVTATYGLAACREEQGDWQAAQTLYESVISIDCDHTAAQTALARLRRKHSRSNHLP